MTAAAALPSASHRKCASCQAPVEFDPTSGALKCAYCSTERAIHAARRVPVHALGEAAAFQSAESSEQRPILACSNCGARAEVASTTVATRCAFCDSPLVPLAQVERLPPAEGVVPFAVDKKDASQRFHAWVRGLWFRPSDLKRLAKLKEMRGVYVPGWIFSADARSEWSAEAGYHYYETETVHVNGRRETRRVQKTRWVPARGSHAGSYTELLVSASKGLPPEELEELDGFDYETALAQFDSDFLAGFEAETHALSVDQCWPVARRRIQRMERDACAREVPGDTHRNLHVATDTSSEAFQSALVPVYVSAYDYAGKIYRVLVNGRTGVVWGQAPWSWVKITLFVLTLVAAAVALYAFVLEPDVGRHWLGN